MIAIHTRKPKLTRGKKLNTDQTGETTMSDLDKHGGKTGKSDATLDDLLKQFNKNQKGNKAIQEQLNSI